MPPTPPYLCCLKWIYYSVNLSLTPLNAHSKHHFLAPSSKLCQNWLHHRRGALYLHATVHWCCQHPLKGLGTNMSVEAILPLTYFTLTQVQIDIVWEGFKYKGLKLWIFALRISVTHLPPPILTGRICHWSLVSPPPPPPPIPYSINKVWFITHTVQVWVIPTHTCIYTNTHAW